MSHRLPGFENVRPPKPTRHDEQLARRIAERLIREIDPDLQDGDAEGFYWNRAELPDRIWELQQAIMSDTPATELIGYCKKNFRSGNWHWDGTDNNCRHYAPIAIREEVERAVEQWRKNYF